LPISFWKDVDAEADDPANLSELKARYVSDGMKAAERPATDGNVLGIWLSGPFTRARVSSESDLHMGILLNHGEHRFYRHQFAEFNETERRLEMAFFPVNYFLSILDTGFKSWVDVFDVHKLSEMEILYDRKNALADLRGHLERLKPRASFIGRQIESIRFDLEHVRRYLKNGDNLASIMISRKIAMDCLKILRLIIEGTTFSKISQLSMVLDLPRCSSLRDSFQMIYGLGRINGGVAGDIVKKTALFVKDLFDRCIHCGGHLN